MLGRTKTCPVHEQTEQEAQQVVDGVPNGHINLRCMLHEVEVGETPLCRKCNAEKKTSVHIFCECSALEKKSTSHGSGPDVSGLDKGSETVVSCPWAKKSRNAKWSSTNLNKEEVREWVKWSLSPWDSNRVSPLSYKKIFFIKNVHFEVTISTNFTNAHCSEFFC